METSCDGQQQQQLLQGAEHCRTGEKLR